MMQTGLHAIGWGLQRTAIVLGTLVLAAGLSYVALVFVIVAIQAAAALNQ
jgi:hypothetical protein